MSSIAKLELIGRDSRKKKHALLLELVVSTTYFQCINLRDIVYAILGLGGDIAAYRDNLVPDYNLPITEVYRRVVIGYILQKSSLFPLSVFYMPLESGVLDLLSWVADFSRLENRNSLMHMRIGTGLPFHAFRDSTTIRLVQNRLFYKILEISKYFLIKSYSRPRKAYQSLNFLKIFSSSKDILI
jgi:hypothetical protein